MQVDPHVRGRSKVHVKCTCKVQHDSAHFKTGSEKRMGHAVEGREKDKQFRSQNTEKTDEAD